MSLLADAPATSRQLITSVSLLLALSLSLGLLAGCSLIGRQRVVFEGTSMLPAIKDGDGLLLSRFDRGARVSLQRGDIVLLRSPADPAKFYIRRLIGLPGETVAIREGNIIVNGSALSEPYVAPRLNVSNTSLPPVQLTERHYYVLGDNRDNASDSRIWGPVPESDILGKVIGR